MDLQEMCLAVEQGKGKKVKELVNQAVLLSVRLMPIIWVRTPIRPMQVKRRMVPKHTYYHGQNKLVKI
ncbi:MAG: hypothetical protein WCG21_13370 [Eubacteriales bacterium]